VIHPQSLALKVTMNQAFPQFIHDVVDRLQPIEGVAAIALGGLGTRGSILKSQM